MTEVFSTTDSTQLFRLSREPENARSLSKMRDGYRKIESEIGSYPFAEPIHKAIDLFDAWLAERDPQKYFQAVIDKRQEAREVIDKCKEVVQFTHDQLPTYKRLRKYASDNKYNFSFVPMNCQGKVDEFVKIETDPWPIKGFRSYITLQRELDIILEEVRNDLREKIRIAYNEQFDYLERVAKEQNVPVSVLANRENTIMTRTTPDNILVLKGNINTDAFYQEQIGKILDYVNAHKPVPQPDDGGLPAGTGAGEEPPKPKKIRQASLQTKTAVPLSTEEDIDRYLKGLKDQLTKLLVDYDSVMIIK